MPEFGRKEKGNLYEITLCDKDNILLLIAYCNRF